MSLSVRFERVARRAGGGVAVAIPAEIRNAVGLKEGQRVYVYVTDDRKIVIEPIR